MDHIKQELDELMGKDRNLPLQERMKKKEHFDDPEVSTIFTYLINLGLQILPYCFLSL
jgi:hypothetical protein